MMKAATGTNICQMTLDEWTPPEMAITPTEDKKIAKMSRWAAVRYCPNLVIRK
jgi:hypothetical protein